MKFMNCISILILSFKGNVIYFSVDLNHNSIKRLPSALFQDTIYRA